MRRWRDSFASVRETADWIHSDSHDSGTDVRTLLPSFSLSLSLSSGSFWHLTGLTLAFGSLLVVSALSWRRVLSYFAERCPEAAKKAAPFSQHFASYAAQAAAAAKSEAATQTAGAAAASVPEAATQVSAAAAAARSRPATESQSRYREYSLGPLSYGHRTVADGETVVHSIDVLRFPRFLDFVSRVSLQFVAAVA